MHCNNPMNPAEWQEAVDLAEVCLLLESARQYGLVTGGPDIDASRCAALLAHGRKLGYTPKADASERLIHNLLRPRR